MPAMPAKRPDEMPSIPLSVTFFPRLVLALEGVHGANILEPAACKAVENCSVAS
jgi:hypothetical protein